jgi:phage tail-like protein
MDALKGDPMIGAHFSLEVQGVITGFFMEVGGLGSETEVTEHKIIGKGHNEAIRKVPGRLKWGDITLKRGITANMDMWDWRKMVEEGKVTNARKNGSIMMHDQEGQVVAKWDFENGWPSKVSGPSLKSDDNAIGMEEMTIVHEGIKRIT